MRDYTCVPTAQLAVAFHRHRDKSVSLAIIAERAGLDVRDLKKIVNEGKYRTTGVGLADRILTAVGANLTALDASGELTVIPSPGDAAVKLMAADEWALRDEGVPYPSPYQRRKRIRELTELRRATLEKY